MLLRHLPRDSATVRAMLPAEELAWTTADHLLAAATDALHVANWQRAGRKRGKPPKRIPRPGDKPDRQKFGRRPMTIGEFEALMARPVTGDSEVKLIR